MKRLGLTPLFAAATLFLGGPVAAEETKSAGSTPNPKPEAFAPAMKPMRGEDLLKRFDKNGDGKLDEDEQADAHEAILQDQMNGKSIEIKSPEGSVKRRQLMLDFFDMNQDGRLDEKERAYALKNIDDIDPGARAIMLMKRFDKDGDGKLNLDELAALVRFQEERERERLLSSLNEPGTDFKKEKERLDRVAAEVARRRELREQAVKAIGAKPEPKP